MQPIDILSEIGSYLSELFLCYWWNTEKTNPNKFFASFFHSMSSLATSGSCYLKVSPYWVMMNQLLLLPSQIFTKWVAETWQICWFYSPNIDIYESKASYQIWSVQLNRYRTVTNWIMKEVTKSARQSYIWGAIETIDKLI